MTVVAPWTAVAVIVTVDVPRGVLGGGGVFCWVTVTPPQPDNALPINTIAARQRVVRWKELRLPLWLRRPKSAKVPDSRPGIQSVAAKASARPSAGPGLWLPACTGARELYGPVVVMVTVSFAPAVPGVSEVGENWQVAKFGKPLQPNVTVGANPSSDASWREKVTDCPPATDALVELGVTCRLGAESTTTSITGEAAAEKSPCCAKVVLREWLPAASFKPLNVAVPVASRVPDPIVVVPSRNVTFPGTASVPVQVTCVVAERVP